MKGGNCYKEHFPRDGQESLEKRHKYFISEHERETGSCKVFREKVVNKGMRIKFLRY